MMEGFQAHVDVSGHTIQKKVMNAEVQHYNYIAVVGKEEKENGNVDVRSQN